MATKVIVRLPDEPDYAARIGSGVMAALGDNLRDIERFQDVRDVLVITDANVAPEYGSRVKSSLKRAGFKPAEIAVNAGETSKSIEVAAEIWQAMATMGLGRDCAVVALGGGAVGDLAGFIASTYMRGVEFVQVPTSLLAMVDAAVGGETAVNLPQGKSLVGTFYQPAFVCVDTDALATLPDREWSCGCAEIAKSAALDSDEFFFWLLDMADKLAAHDEETAAEAVKRCIVFKAGVVASDKTEREDVRICLDYGHTLGHAIEVAAGYGVFTHGEAVAEGMRFAARLACDELGVAHDFEQAQSQLLDSLGLTGLTWNASVGDVMRAIAHDKKARKGETRFVVVSDVGKWTILPLSDDKVDIALERWRNEEW